MAVELFSGITNHASSHLRVGVNEPPTEVNAIEIVLGGDTECETFIQALEHALNVLKAQFTANRLTTASKPLE